MPEARFDVQDAAEAVLHMAHLPLKTNGPFLMLMASTMPFAGRG